MTSPRRFSGRSRNHQQRVSGPQVFYRSRARFSCFAEWSMREGGNRDVGRATPAGRPGPPPAAHARARGGQGVPRAARDPGRWRAVRSLIRPPQRHSCRGGGPWDEGTCFAITAHRWPDKPSMQRRLAGHRAARSGENTDPDRVSTGPPIGIRQGANRTAVEQPGQAWRPPAASHPGARATRTSVGQSATLSPPEEPAAILFTFAKLPSSQRNWYTVGKFPIMLCRNQALSLIYTPSLRRFTNNPG